MKYDRNAWGLLVAPPRPTLRKPNVNPAPPRVSPPCQKSDPPSPLPTKWNWFPPPPPPPPVSLAVANRGVVAACRGDVAASRQPAMTPPATAAARNRVCARIYASSKRTTHSLAAPCQERVNPVGGKTDAVCANSGSLI